MFIVSLVKLEPGPVADAWDGESVYDLKTNLIPVTKEDPNLPGSGVLLNISLEPSPGSLNFRVSIELRDNLGFSSWKDYSAI